MRASSPGPPVEHDDMLARLVESCRAVTRFFQERAPVVAAAQGLAYPAELDALISGRLEHLLPRGSTSQP